MGNDRFGGLRCCFQFCAQLLSVEIVMCDPVVISECSHVLYFFFPKLIAQTDCFLT